MRALLISALVITQVGSPASSPVPSPAATTAVPTPTPYPRQLPPDYVNFPILVTVGTSQGSGFYVHHKQDLFFVTARHVVFGNGNAPGATPVAHAPSPNDAQEVPLAASAVLVSRAREMEEAGRNVMTLDLVGLTKDGGLRSDTLNDVSVMRVGLVGPEGRDFRVLPHVTIGPWTRSGISLVPASMLRKFRDVLISNEVFIFGFPNAIGLKNAPQIDQSRSLMRRGIVAGTNPLLKTIIIDTTAHHGNSGGPVVEVDRVDLARTEHFVIGVVTQIVPYRTPDGDFGNSGYAVAAPIDAVVALMDALP